MKMQGKQNHTNYAGAKPVRRGLSAFLLLFVFSLVFPFHAYSELIQLSVVVEDSSNKVDSLKTIEGELPIVEDPKGYTRPRFETVNLVSGLGWGLMDISEIKRMGEIHRSNGAVSFPVYIYIPVDDENPSVFVLSGFDLILDDISDPSFKLLMLYQTRSPFTIGLGGGRASLSYSEYNLNIRASQSHALVAIGMKLSPQRVDLLVTIPVAPSLKTHFEGGVYAIRPAGVQFSILATLR